jgi:hypothetical protein
MPPSLTTAFLKIGTLAIVFGVKEAACLALGYYALYWLISGENGYE